jgi:hypothetical protein
VPAAHVTRQQPAGAAVLAGPARLQHKYLYKSIADARFRRLAPAVLRQSLSSPTAMHVIRYPESATERAGVSGIEGVMLTFDDFLIGMDQFGRRLQPLMRCRNTLLQAA